MPVRNIAVSQGVLILLVRKCRFRLRNQGLSLVEVMVTLLLTSVAFGLIYSLSQAQAKFQRHQQLKELFLVDTDALTCLLDADLATAFLAQVNNSTQTFDIGHLARDSEPGSGAPPFNSLPVTGAPSASGPPPPTDPTFRGKPIRTTYTLIGEQLRRESVEIPTTAPVPPVTSTSPFRNQVVMERINGISWDLQDSRIELNLTLISDGSVHILKKFFFAPGLSQ